MITCLMRFDIKGLCLTLRREQVLHTYGKQTTSLQNIKDYYNYYIIIISINKFLFLYLLTRYSSKLIIRW